MGQGTKDKPLRIHCSNNTLPSDGGSSGSAAGSKGTGVATAKGVRANVADCDLGAEWVVTNPYPQLAEVEVRIDQWEPDRIVTLRFENQELTVMNLKHATLEDSFSDGTDTVALFKLEQVTNSGCNTGHVSNGVYVRDTNCGGSDEPKPFFNMQLQPSPTDAPRMFCTIGPPPPPPDYVTNPDVAFPDINAGLRAPTTSGLPPLQSPAPPPPSPPSPPPPRPTVDVFNCAAGGVATVEGHMHSGELETMHISVKPSYLWPTGFAYVVMMRGMHLQVSGVTGATLEPVDMRGFNDPEKIHQYSFHPQPSASKIDFQVQGIDPKVVSATCRPVHPSPSPPAPLPMPPAAPPPLLDTLKANIPVNIRSSFQFSLGLRSFASRASVGVIAALMLISLCLRLRGGSNSRAARRRYEAGPVYGGETELGNVGEQGEWSVELQLAGQTVDMPLPQSVATSGSELKQALAELAIEVLGAEALPTEWLADDLTSMCVHYSDGKGRMTKMRPSTSFRQLCASRTLQVSVE